MTKTRIIKKVFRETYEFRWIKKLKKLIKCDMKNWKFPVKEVSNFNNKNR